MIGATAVAVREMKRQSWQMNCAVVRPAADPDEYHGYHGETLALLRVANQVAARRERFDWASHEAIVGELPSLLLGHNPGLAKARPARDWEDGKEALRSHRLYVHTAGEGLDDGYNMASVEAMMTGMPVISTPGSESPVVNGQNGFISRDPLELHQAARALLEDLPRARALGAEARRTALREFSLDRFKTSWHREIESAIRRFRDRRAS